MSLLTYAGINQQLHLSLCIYLYRTWFLMMWQIGIIVNRIHNKLYFIYNMWKTKVLKYINKVTFLHYTTGPACTHKNSPQTALFHFYTSVLAQIKQHMTCSLASFSRCWWADSVTCGRSQDGCFSPTSYFYAKLSELPVGINFLFDGETWESGVVFLV